MKKIEILNLINASRIITKNKKLLVLAKDEKLPEIVDLQEEFKILKKEIDQAHEETNNRKKYINSINCNHEVRLEHYGIFTNNYKCIFCNKSIIGDNCINWEYSKNRNKYCVDLVAKYQEDEDCGYIKDGYTDEDIYQIIINIITEKEDNEDIDLVQEFKKLNLLKCKINEEKKNIENYILIIGGTNRQYIDEESYISQQSQPTSLKYAKYFQELLNTKIEIIDLEETITSETAKKYFSKDDYNIKLTKYSTKEELEKILIDQQEIPFKLIIDLSELYTYQINSNNVLKTPYHLKLRGIFPQANIIKINNSSNKNDLETTCNKIKKLLRN